MHAGSRLAVALALAVSGCAPVHGWAPDLTVRVQAARSRERLARDERRRLWVGAAVTFRSRAVRPSVTPARRAGAADPERAPPPCRVPAACAWERRARGRALARLLGGSR